MNRIIECIPNFSEGKNQETIAAIAAAIKNVTGVKLLHQDSGKAANRTVFTFAGELEAVLEAAFMAIKVATTLIDMQQHKGEHPRIGSCDVCPFVPISGISMEQLVPYVEEFAIAVHKEFNIPIYFYEYSSKQINRRNLAMHRIGNYEALKSRIESGKWLPDLGKKFNATTGGCVIGVRNFLVAYNINLKSKDANLAKEIAFDLRTLGRAIKKENGKTIYRPGKLQAVKAIGWYIEDFELAQVSINLIDFNITSLSKVYETTKEIAKNYNIELSGSELIGLIPKQALIDSGQFYYSSSNKATDEHLIESAIKGLGLDNLKPFDPQERILEYVLMR